MNTARIDYLLEEGKNGYQYIEETATKAYLERNENKLEKCLRNIENSKTEYEKILQPYQPSQHEEIEIQIDKDQITLETPQPIKIFALRQFYQELKQTQQKVEEIATNYNKMKPRTNKN